MAHYKQNPSTYVSSSSSSKSNRININNDDATATNLNNNTTTGNCHITCDVCDIDNEELVALVGEGMVETVVSHDIVGRVMVQCSLRWVMFMCMCVCRFFDY